LQRTRRSILEFLKQRGRATLDELAQDAGIAPMSVRGHLNILERDGLISYEEARGRVGRPRFVYSLTEQGQDQFPKNYHTLCNRILDALTVSPEVTSADLASKIADVWAADHAPRLVGKTLEEKLKILTTIRTEEGAMASLEKTSDGYLLVQRNCPASCVAARHPQVICTAEIGFIKRVLGETVERVSWIQKGDATCSYRIRASQSESSPARRAMTVESPSTKAIPFRPAPAE
jgi:DeoR family suf operon transcriptional repressor